jgi:hypothetical protein
MDKLENAIKEIKHVLNNASERPNELKIILDIVNSIDSEDVPVGPEIHIAGTPGVNKMYGNPPSNLSGIEDEEFEDVIFNEVSIGEVVYLNSDKSIPMTVRMLHTHSKEIVTMYFNKNGSCKTSTFKVEMLCRKIVNY